MRLSHEELKELIHYDPVTGNITRLDLGRQVGRANKRGYVEIRLKGVLYYGHQLAWFYMTGTWLPRVDHENGQRSDNRWSNLRKATRTQNNRNTVKRVTNKSGYKGVSFHTVMKQWRATITVDRKQLILGYSNDPVLAAHLYDAAAINHHGQFAKTNKMLGLI